MLNDEDFETAKDNLEVAVREMAEGVKGLLKSAGDLKVAHELAEHSHDMYLEHKAVQAFLLDVVRVEERMKYAPRLVTSELNNIIMGVMRAHGKRNTPQPAENQPGPEQ